MFFLNNWDFLLLGLNTTDSRLATLYTSYLLHIRSTVCTSITGLGSTMLEFTLGHKIGSEQNIELDRILTISVEYESQVPYFLMVPT